MNYTPIQEFPNYKIDQAGNIINSRGVLLKGEISRGYKRYTLSKNNRSVRRYAHVLVWDTFGDRPKQDGEVIDHIDSNRLNSHITNLQLISQKENVIKAKVFIEVECPCCGSIIKLEHYPHSVEKAKVVN